MGERSVRSSLLLLMKKISPIMTQILQYSHLLPERNFKLSGAAIMRASGISGLAENKYTREILQVEDLWDSIAAQESSVPIPNRHMMELDRRLGKYASVPGNLLSLEELRSRIEQRK